ncbi:addiction module protein [Porticoccus sp.]|uniref:addiction module protein n=1 Tax=Porticoccus sp. TaxID=2024853 RepID=UPI003F69D9D6
MISEREVFSMNLQKIENEALHLLKEERVQLIQRLVLSLESPSEEELKSDWLLEAQRRGEELDNGSVQAVSGEDVMRKARAFIK